MRSITGHSLSALHRLIAVLGVAWVLALGVLAVRPDLHEALCHHQATAAGQQKNAEHNGSDGCVVTQFAQGHVLPAPVFLPFLAGVFRLVAHVSERTLEPVAFAFALPPSCGPPAS